MNSLLIILVAMTICLSQGVEILQCLLCDQSDVDCRLRCQDMKSGVEILQCLLCDQSDVDCRLRCQDMKSPEILSRVRRQDCRTCTRESDDNCWNVCSFYFGVCLSSCDLHPSTYCVRDCQVKYNRL